MPHQSDAPQHSDLSILDLRGVGIFPSRPPDPSISGAEDLSPFLVTVDENATPDRHVDEEGMVTLTFRVTPEEVELLMRRQGAHQIEEPGTQDALFARGILSSEIFELTPDERGTDYDAINCYFCDFKPKNIEAVERLSASLPPLHPSCRASICIPVAAHEEGRNIYRTLKAFTRQTVAPQEFDIILFLNHPAHDSAGNVVVPDSTLEEVQRFKKDFPHINVHAFYTPLAPAEANIGFIRKFLNDVALHRHFQRGPKAEDFYLIRVDADTHGVKPRYLENYFKLFKAHPEVDAFKGKLDWDWGGYLKDPALLFGTRLFLALDAYINAKENDVGGGGANFAIRAARYADIGGYHPDKGMAEDVQLGSSLKSLRLGAKHHIAIKSAGAPSLLWTDNRRGMAALLKGHAPVCQWHNGDTDFGAMNSEIRKVPLAASEAGFEDLLFAADFPERVSKLVQQTFDFYTVRNDPVRHEYVAHVLPKLGVQAGVAEDGSITIYDISGLIRSSKNFYDHAPTYWSEVLKFDPIERTATS